jgi:hypothetical protein
MGFGDFCILSRRLLIVFVTSFVWILTGCGETGLYRKLEDAGRIQGDIDASALSLWERSPTADSSNYALKASDDLGKVPRKSVTLPGLLSKSNSLESDDIIVLDATLTAFSIPFSKWAGRRPFWDTDDFQMLMAYAHAARSLEYVRELFPNGNFSFKAYDAANRLTVGQLSIFAAEIGDIFGTSYNPTRKSISFYRHGGDGELAKFNPVLEADAVYHEMAHYISHALSCPVGAVCPTDSNNVVTMSVGVNTDLDAIQEGLADFFASVMTNDDRNFTFLNNNARELVSPQSRNGVDFFRSVGNDLFFPDGFRQSAHLDGRVVSAALNDFRKYLLGKTVKKVNCTVSATETCNFSVRSSPLSAERANAFAVKLAFNAFAELVRSSSYTDYALLLTELCVAGENCPDTGTASSVLRQILIQRGLISSFPVIADNSSVVFSQNEEVADLYINSELGWRPFPDNTDLADSDSFIEPCELILVYPRIRNSTQARVTKKVLHNLKAQLMSVDGFTEVRVSDRAIDPFPTASMKPSKLLGWLSPNDEFGVLEKDATSRLYTVRGSSTFTKLFGKNFTVPSMGWIMFAPNELGKSGSLRFKYKTRIFNSRLSGEVESSDNLVSSLSVVSQATANSEAAAGRTLQNYTCGF